MHSHGYAAHDARSPLVPFSFDRRDPGPEDVALEILYSGICHSDIHQARNEWGNSLYPMVPGHEIVGRVIAAGRDVTKFREGDLAAVGVISNSCRVCANCRAGEESYCEKGAVGTYNARDYDGMLMQGGYASNIITHERYVHTLSPRFADKLPAVAPLLCAGITTYSPLRHWKVGAGKKVGIVGLGGLGHMGLKFAHAFGAHTVLFTTSANKIDDARKLGADEVVISTDSDAMAKRRETLDFVLDCVSAPHNVADYLNLLRLDGTMCLVGLPETPLAIPPFSVTHLRRSFAGSDNGGMPEVQQMLDWCADHDVVSEVELTPIDKVNQAYDRVLKGDVKYRFVIDIKTLKS